MSEVKQHLPDFETIDDASAAILRAMTPAQKLAVVNGMWRSARRLLLATIAQDHSAWTQERVEREVARRMSHGTS